MLNTNMEEKMKKIFIVFCGNLITLAVMMITSGCYIRAGFYDQGIIDSTGKSVLTDLLM